MISRIRSSPYLKLLSMLNSAPSAAFARAKRPPHPAQEKVGLKLTWPMTYSRKLAPRCMSPNCSHAFSPPLASPSIAKASSRPSPRKSPARTASSAPRRTLSACDRRPDDLAGGFPGYRRRLALRLPSIAHLPACCSPSSGLVGGKWRKVRYKEVALVYWQGGAARCPLRLLVVAPTPYRKRKSNKLYYRQPAYLLTTDLKSSAKPLLQIYFDRWQIEVNPRDEKDTLGVGQAQLWNVKAVPKQPVLAVAAYSAMLLASLIAFGAERGAAYEALPKWRKRAYRPSCLDLVTLLRKEMVEHPELLKEFEVKVSEKQFVRSAAA